MDILSLLGKKHVSVRNVNPTKKTSSLTVLSLDNTTSSRSSASAVSSQEVPYTSQTLPSPRSQAYTISNGHGRQFPGYQNRDVAHDYQQRQTPNLPRRTDSLSSYDSNTSRTKRQAPRVPGQAGQTAQTPAGAHTQTHASQSDPENVRRLSRAIHNSSPTVRSSSKGNMNYSPVTYSAAKYTVAGHGGSKGTAPRPPITSDSRRPPSRQEQIDSLSQSFAHVQVNAAHVANDQRRVKKKAPPTPNASPPQFRRPYPTTTSISTNASAISDTTTHGTYHTRNDRNQVQSNHKLEMNSVSVSESDSQYFRYGGTNYNVGQSQTPNHQNFRRGLPSNTNYHREPSRSAQTTPLRARPVSEYHNQTTHERSKNSTSVNRNNSYATPRRIERLDQNYGQGFSRFG